MMIRLYKKLTPVLLGALLIATLALPLEAQALSFTGLAAGGGLAWAGCKAGTLVGALFGGVGAPIGCVAGLLAGATIGYVWGDNVGSTVIDYLAKIIVFLAQIIISVLLNWAVQLLSFGVEMSKQSISHFGPVDSMVQVSASVANLFLIAIFIFIAIATILDVAGAGGGYNIRKTLPMLIFAILLVNFSGVFVGVLVDAGNTLMSFFWENSNLKSINLPDYIIQNMKISQAVASNSQKDMEAIFRGGNGAKTSASLGVAGIYLLVALLGLYAAYIFLRLAIIFIMRIGAIWLLLITAPLVFVAGVLPPMRGNLKRWWSELLNWAFIGPITFFFLFFGLAMWGELNRAFAQELQKTAGQDVQGFSLFLIFPIIAFFFSYALSTSKKMAGAAANGIIDGAIGIGKGVALGSAALAGGAVLAGVGSQLGRITRSEWVGKAANALERRGFNKSAGLIKTQRASEIKKHEDKISSRRAAYQKMAEDNPDQLKSEFKKSRKIPYIRGAEEDAVNKAAMIHAMLEEGEELSPEMKKYAATYGKAKDATLEKAVQTLYPDTDDKIYNGQAIIPVTGYKRMIEKFRDPKVTQWKIGLDGFANTIPVGTRPTQTGGIVLTPQQEALMLLAPNLDKADKNQIAKRPALLKKYRDLILSISPDELNTDGSQDNIFSELSIRSNFSPDYLRSTFNQLHEWATKTAAQNLATTFRNAPSNPNNP